MKKIAVIILALAMITTIFAACSADANDPSSLNDYTSPSYDFKTETGTFTFTPGVGATAIITKYSPTNTDPHEVVIPETVGADNAKRTVVGIGKEAFYFCSAITGVVIPETVTLIDELAFAECQNLASINVPAAVTSVGAYAFAGCNKLATVEFATGSELTSIGDFAFYKCSALASINLPEGLKTIGIETFRDCVSLTSIVCPSTLEKIGNMAFYNCTGLNTPGALVLSASITEIGEFAFGSINKLYIVAPEGSYAAEYVDAMRDYEEPETETEE